MLNEESSILFVRLTGTAQKYLFGSYQSLKFLHKIHSAKETFQTTEILLNY